jgi:phage protein D
MRSATVKEHIDKSLGDIVRDLAGKGGLVPMIDPELENKKIPFLNQFNSPYHMMHDLERRFGGVFKVENGVMMFGKRGSDTDAGGNQMPHVVIKPEHILSYSAKHTERTKYGKVVAEYWDSQEHKRKTVEVQNEAFSSQDGDTTPHRVGGTSTTKEEAEAAAKARKEALNRMTGEITIELSKGDPWIRAGFPLHVIGLCDGANGSYIIDTVTHNFTQDRGLTTQIFATAPNGGMDEFQDAYQEYRDMPLAGELLGQYGPMSHRQPGSV